LKILSRTSLVAFIASVSVTFFCSAPCLAEFSKKLVDRYLESQFEWAMFLGAEDAEHYLNYRGSSLQPLTKVSVYYRAFPPDDKSRSEKDPAKEYEDFWYHKGRLLGSRYRNRLHLPEERNGAIVIGKTSGGSEEARALSNALVRVVLDLHFQKIFVDVVLVPLQQYDLIVGNMGQYRFFRSETPPESGKQMSIHFRSYPSEKDDVYYMH
jgi:hypothetical protein